MDSLQVTKAQNVPLQIQSPPVSRPGSSKQLGFKHKTIPQDLSIMILLQITSRNHRNSLAFHSPKSNQHHRPLGRHKIKTRVSRSPVERLEINFPVFNLQSKTQERTPNALIPLLQTGSEKHRWHHKIADYIINPKSQHQGLDLSIEGSDHAHSTITEALRLKYEPSQPNTP